MDSSKSILVIAPHPDDETLGCGGTLLRHISAGDKVYWLICTTITESQGFTKERIEERKKEINFVSNMYRFTGYKQLDFHTTELDQVPRNVLINSISDYVNEIQPHTIYLPYRNDVHSDHAYVFDASVACTKSFRYPIVKKVYVYETLSETEYGLRTDDPGFKPNTWVNISKFLERKLEIMKVYRSEIGNHPFPRSVKGIESLATIRGLAANQAYSESFICLKDIQN
jgi:LmbE family N-acetylglucosaminyl deacetylase